MKKKWKYFFFFVDSGDMCAAFDSSVDYMREGFKKKISTVTVNEEVLFCERCFSKEKLFFRYGEVKVLTVENRGRKTEE